MRWQDVALLVANAVFVLQLVPLLLSPRTVVHRFVSAPLAFGLLLIAVVYMSLGLTAGAGATSLEALGWWAVVVYRGPRDEE